MASKLVIVESPAKAKTISSYLGSDYEVLASIGHIRDLLPNGKDLPAEMKKKWWSDYAVDVDNNYAPIYEVPKEKSAQVSKLRAALKGKDTLVLATDEDREGESISWHLLEVLKPNKGVKVQRIAFHEITKEAILNAIRNPRDLDTKLVEAQEARRILDRLYGYTLSPVLWSRVSKNLSAGRVQSPAVKLIVEREEQRRKFVASEYWDLSALFASGKETFPGTLRRIDNQRLATGKDFNDETGAMTETKNPPLLLGPEDAAAYAAICKEAKPYLVSKLESKEGVERPAPPFMTTTLQQEANRKLGFSADRTMRIAQTLYEGIDIRGEQVGLITYMRTDSLTLSQQALTDIRKMISEVYPDCLPEKPVAYASKVRNAQEAHEAIRPTDAKRRPADMAKYLNTDQQKLYDLIWKRTVASQMKNAKVLRTEVEVSTKAQGKTFTFSSSGKQILFDGFQRLYLEDSDDPEAEKDGMERKLPRLQEGQEVTLAKIGAEGHSTKPPARFTDASIIKKLEENGIGRPSTYASIISTIEDRGYIRKVSKQLVPTWKAYLTMEVLEKSFEEFMGLNFTAKMDDALDDIAEGKINSRVYLASFFEGTEANPGLHPTVKARKADIPFPAFVLGHLLETEEPMCVRQGKNGNAFLQVGEGDSRRFGDIPEDLAPADLTMAKALELLTQRGQPTEILGIDPVTGRNLHIKNRQGYYLETERTQEEIEKKVKPRWISVPAGMDPKDLAPEELSFLCQLPRLVGTHPLLHKKIEFKLGKFGAYLECEEERRTVDDWRKGMTIDVDEAVEILNQPKTRGAARVSAGPIKEFGEIKVLSGRFGPYVTDGKTNATLPKSMDPAQITEEEAKDLIKKKEEAGPSAPRKSFKKSSFKKATTKKVASKKKK